MASRKTNGHHRLLAGVLVKDFCVDEAYCSSIVKPKTHTAPLVP